MNFGRIIRVKKIHYEIHVNLVFDRFKFDTTFKIYVFV